MNKILFNYNYGMEAAAIAGTKTQLRRVIKFKDFGSRVVRYTPLPGTKGSARYHLEDGRKVVDYETLSTYRLGEIVAIGQSYADVKAYYEGKGLLDGEEYKAFIKEVEGVNKEYFNAGRKDKFLVKPHLMPHHIQILSVRTQRLQDITEEECLAEGILKEELQGETKYYIEDSNTGGRCYFKTARDAFAFFMSQTEKNMRNVWVKNPPVYVYTFETID